MPNCKMCTPGGEGTYVCTRCIDEMRRLLSEVAYCRRGTKDEKMTIYDMSEEILKVFTREQLMGNN